MRLGSVCSGIGGLDLAVERHYGATPVWQVDYDPDRPRYGAYTAAVRARHWPGVEQHAADMRTLDPAAMPPIDILCGGFPCQDLSVAGLRAGLEGRKSRLYYTLLEWARVLRPSVVVLENVPALLSQHGPQVTRDLSALGYGVTWVPITAAHAGAMHLRARVFVVARRGAPMGGIVDAGQVPDLDRWATPRASDDRGPGRHPDMSINGEPLSVQVRHWPTPTPTARDGKDCGEATNYARQASRGLLPGVVNVPPRLGTRLSPWWVEQLMGLPAGWTEREGPRLVVDGPPVVAPRIEGLDGDSPQHAWEARRTLPDGAPCPDRPARLRGCGNAVHWPQALLALHLATRRRQRGLFG